MSWRELGQTWNDGDTVLSDDLTDTFNPMLSEINGRIDRDNFGYRLITDAKIVVNAVNRQWHNESDAALTGIKGVQAILETTIDAEEWITVACQFTYVETANAYVYPYLQVGDVIVAIGDWEDATLPGQRDFHWSGPVQPGTQNVILGVGVGSAVFGTVGVITVNSRGMTVVEGRR